MSRKGRPARPKAVFGPPTTFATPSANASAASSANVSRAASRDSRDSGSLPPPTPLPEEAPQTLALLDFVRSGHRALLPSNQVPSLAPSRGTSRNRSASSRSTSRSRRFHPLAPIDRSDTDELRWTHVGRFPLAKLWHQIEALEHDYVNPEYAQHPDLEIHWIGHPHDKPFDIRARDFMVAWKEQNPPPFLKNNEPVFRVSYNCLGSCSWPSDDDADESDDMDAAPAPEPLETVAPDMGTHPQESLKRRRILCPGKGRLQVEILANNLQAADIWTVGPLDHARPLDKNCLASAYIGHQIMDCAALGMTAGAIKQRLMTTYQNYAILPCRQHSARQVADIVQNWHRAGRYDHDPIRAIGTLAEKLPESLYHFQAHDPLATPPTKFSVAVTDAFAIENLIINASDLGVGLDSSWRNKNENRAPLTFLITVNKETHCLPGAAYLSEDVQATTLEEFLRVTKDRIEDYALKISTDQVELEHEDPADVAKLKQEAIEIVAHGWNPAFFMIDKSRAEANAIKAIWPDMVIRLCQFHVIQAILRFDGETDGDERPSLSIPRKRLLCCAFRSLQRCRLLENWPAMVQTFKEKVTSIIAEKPLRDRVWSYFERNWFNTFWRSMWTDMGLPDGRNRDGMLNTNNWTERSFKTLDQLFLHCRSNKRLDRLVIILAHEWFPFWRLWSPTGPVRNAALLHEIQEGHYIWGEPHMLRQLDENTWRVSEFKSEDRFVVAKVSGALTCTCAAFDQTGRSCCHIWAVRLLLGNGDAGIWIANECIRMNKGSNLSGFKAAAPKRPKGSIAPPRRLKDSKITEALDAVIEDFEKGTTFELLSRRLVKADDNGDSSSEPSDNDVGPLVFDPAAPELHPRAKFGVASAGRPASIKPLQPWRKEPVKQQSSSSLRFSQKPGRPAGPTNSLLPAKTQAEKALDHKVSHDPKGKGKQAMSDNNQSPAPDHLNSFKAIRMLSAFLNCLSEALGMKMLFIAGEYNAPKQLAEFSRLQMDDNDENLVGLWESLHLAFHKQKIQRILFFHFSPASQHWYLCEWKRGTPVIPFIYGVQNGHGLQDGDQVTQLAIMRRWLDLGEPSHIMYKQFSIPASDQEEYDSALYMAGLAFYILLGKRPYGTTSEVFGSISAHTVISSFAQILDAFPGAAISRSELEEWIIPLHLELPGSCPDDLQPHGKHFFVTGDYDVMDAVHEEEGHRLSIVKKKTVVPKEERPVVAKEGSFSVDELFSYANTSDKSTVLLKIHKQSITPHDIARLSNATEWFNDELINAWAVAHDGGFAQGSWHNVLSFFYTKLSEFLAKRDDKVFTLRTALPPEERSATQKVFEQDVISLHRWFKCDNIFQLSHINIPINVDNSHWVLATIDFQKKTIIYLDSLVSTSETRIANKTDDKHNTFVNLLDYLDAYSTYKKNQHPSRAAEFNIDRGRWKATMPNVPQQKDAVSCGAFTCFYIATLSGSPRATTFNKLELEPIAYRRTIAEQLISKHLELKSMDQMHVETPPGTPEQLHQLQAKIPHTPPSPAVQEATKRPKRQGALYRR